MSWYGNAREHQNAECHVLHLDLGNLEAHDQPNSNSANSQGEFVRAREHSASWEELFDAGSCG